MKVPLLFFYCEAGSNLRNSSVGSREERMPDRDHAGQADLAGYSRRKFKHLSCLLKHEEMHMYPLDQPDYTG